MTQQTRLADGEEIPSGVSKLERTRNGIAVYGGLDDPRMGTNSLDIPCKTCGCKYSGNSKMNDCPGHFGHIELCRAVYHCGFIEDVVRILRCVCFNCSRLLLDEQIPKDREVLKVVNPETRYRMIHDRCNRTVVKCELVGSEEAMKLLDEDGETRRYMDDILGVPMEDVKEESKAKGARAPCGFVQPKFKRDGQSIFVTFSGEDEGPSFGPRTRELSAQEAYEILRKMTDEDVKSLGFNPKLARPDVSCCGECCIRYTGIDKWSCWVAYSGCLSQSCRCHLRTCVRPSLRVTCSRKTT